MISMCIYFYAHKWTLTFVLINRLQFKEKGVIVWWRIKAQCESQPLSTAALPSHFLAGHEPGPPSTPGGHLLPGLQFPTSSEQPVG